MRSYAYSYLTFACLIWGLAGPISKYTLNYINPWLFLGYRFTLSGILAVLIMAWLFIKQPKDILSLTKSPKAAFFHSLLSTPVSLILLFTGLSHTTLIEASLITSIYPVAVTIASAHFLREAITKQQKLGILIAFTGTLFIGLWPLFESHPTLPHFGANILIILYIISDTTAAILAKYATNHSVTPFILPLTSFILAPLITVPLMFFSSTNALFEISTLPIDIHISTLYMAFFSGSIAYWLFVKGQKLIGASETSLFWYLIPLFQLPLAVLWLHEEIGLHHLVGASIILTGVTLAELKKN